MDKTRFSQLAGQVAASLGLIRHETWTAAGPLYGHAYDQVLQGPGQARVQLSMHWQGGGKVTVRGVYPEGAPGGRRTYQAGVDPARGAEVIAKEANRRVIAAGYADDLVAAIEAKRTSDRRSAERVSWLAKAAELFGIDPPQDSDDIGRNITPKLYLGRFVQGSGYVESYGWGADTGHLSITLSGIPAEVALAMLKVLASSQAVRASCCFTYGPDHPPQFSVTGCLYRDQNVRERGEDASRERVRTFLVRSRGVRPADAARALDAAREHGAEVIEPRGQVLASVITWNHENCGEYTVEVPRER